MPGKNERNPWNMGTEMPYLGVVRPQFSKLLSNLKTASTNLSKKFF